MKNKNDGGSVFTQETKRGMLLRDYFAAIATRELETNIKLENGIIEISQTAYMMADLMIADLMMKEREK